MFDLARGIESLKTQWIKMSARQEMIVEDRRLIAREKLMIDPMSLVLIDDFFEYAVNPAVDSHGAFTSIFRDGSGIGSAAIIWRKLALSQHSRYLCHLLKKRRKIELLSQ